MRRPVIEWPHGKKICATLTVAFEAFTRGGHFKKTKPGEVNLVSISHANYGGNAGIWRIMEILERYKARATIDINGLAVEKWPEATKALHAAGLGHRRCARCRCTGRCSPSRLRRGALR